MSKKSITGQNAFESYYGEIFGPRWATLRSALLKPVEHVAWKERLLQPYYLDSGSIEAALALPPPVSGKVLDMCAAPGGKTLVLAGSLDQGSTLTANEFSRDRRKRLVTVLDQHLDSTIREKITVTCRDAARWSRYEQNAYDRILLDAPCSSERHVLSAPAYLAQWSPARIRNLAARQWALLSGAFLVLATGGYLLYSTCALSPHENDGIISRLVRKYSNARVLHLDGTANCAGSALLSEKTLYGRHILPDISSGAGPLYYALIRKDAVK